MVEDLLYSSRNMIAVKEEMLQLNDMFKLLMSLHMEYGAIVSEEDQMENDEWFDLVDEEVFAFKRKINLWLKNVEEDQRSERTHFKGSSKKSVKSNMTKTSGSSADQVVQKQGH